jgi:hypothetical protein
MGGVLNEYTGIDSNWNPIWLLQPSQFNKKSMTLLIPTLTFPFTWT